MAHNVESDTISNASFSASTVTTTRPRHPSVGVEDTAAEVALQAQISDLLARTTRRVVRRPSRLTTGVDDGVQSFLRANGINLDGSVSYMNGDAMGVNDDVTTAAQPVPDTEHCESQEHEQDLREMQQLVRRLDSERRSLRQRVAHQQKELDLRLAERAAARRCATESHHRNLQLDSLLAVARRRVRAVEEREDECTEELMRLRRLVRALPPSVLSTLITSEDNCATAAATRTARTMTTTRLVPDRRFEEAFRDKMGVITYKRRYRKMRELYTLTSAKLEALHMSHDDVDAALQIKQIAPHEDNAGYIFMTSRPHNSDGVDGAATGAAKMTLTPASDDGLRAWRLTFSPVTAEDSVIRGLLTQSRFTIPLRRVRDELLRLTSRLAESQNRGVNDMYGVFLHFLRRSAPAREADRRIFESQMAKMQQRLHDLLSELVRRVNGLVTELVAVEKGEGGGDVGASLPGVLAAMRPYRRDVACSAVYVSDAEFAVHRLERQMEQQKCAAWTTQRELQQKLEAMTTESRVAREAALAALTHLDMLQKAVMAAVATTTTTTTALHESDKEELLLAELGRLDDAVLADPRLAAKLSETTEWAVRRLRRLSCPVATPREADDVSSSDHTTTSPPPALRPGRENVPPPPRHAGEKLTSAKPFSVRRVQRQKQRLQRHGKLREVATPVEPTSSTAPLPLAQAVQLIPTICLPPATTAAKRENDGGRTPSCEHDPTTTIIDVVKSGSIAIPRPHPHELAPIQNKASRLRAAAVLARRNTMPIFANTISHIDGADVLQPSSPTCMAHSLRSRPNFNERTL